MHLCKTKLVMRMVDGNAITAITHSASNEKSNLYDVKAKVCHHFITGPHILS